MHAGGDFSVPERIVIDAYNKLPSIDPTVNLGVRLDADANISDVVPIDYGLLTVTTMNATLEDFNQTVYAGIAYLRIPSPERF